MTKGRLQEILDKWQPRLGLSDWDIVISFRDCRDMSQSVGRCSMQQNVQYADIRIMQEEDRQKTDRADGDIEIDVLHELIHIRLWAIDPDAGGDEALHTCREQAIEWLARSMIAADRQIKIYKK